MRLIHGQYIRSLWKSSLLILTLTGLFVGYLLVKPSGSAPERVTLVDNVIQGLLEGVGLLLTLPLFLPGIYRSPFDVGEEPPRASRGLWPWS